VTSASSSRGPISTIAISPMRTATVTPPAWPTLAVPRQQRRDAAQPGTLVVLYCEDTDSSEAATLGHHPRRDRRPPLPRPRHRPRLRPRRTARSVLQLMEIRAALGRHFVGFNTGRWDYINSVSDALAGPRLFEPQHRCDHHDLRVHAGLRGPRPARSTPDLNGHYALWQGGMEPNIPVGTDAAVDAAMQRAVWEAARAVEAPLGSGGPLEDGACHAAGVAEVGDDNQLAGRSRRHLHGQDASALRTLEDAPRTVRGARDLISVGLQYGNAFGRGFQAAALKPADFFGDDGSST